MLLLDNQPQNGSAYNYFLAACGIIYHFLGNFLISSYLSIFAQVCSIIILIMTGMNFYFMWKKNKYFTKKEDKDEDDEYK